MDPQQTRILGRIVDALIAEPFKWLSVIVIMANIAFVFLIGLEVVDLLRALVEVERNLVDAVRARGINPWSSGAR